MAVSGGLTARGVMIHSDLLLRFDIRSSLVPVHREISEPLSFRAAIFLVGTLSLALWGVLALAGAHFL
jgi:hypothetical protein